ncbi:MAG: UDP-N-acetylglucosamine 1-carboxyvinyltransferase, partial [Clostridia bacterium]|nr:UDP-N-acetylglucosamine 1-carboxyvinyltransferase [Clostridia bacterium]
MDRLLISGGRSLSGTIAIKSAKNAILPIMAATLLAEGDFIIHNCPNISDIQTMGKMLDELGGKYQFIEGNIYIDSSSADKYIISTELAKELRSSIFLLGGVLGRCKKAVIPYPGGCDIGMRPINIHLKGFAEMGVKIEERHGLIYCDSEKAHAADVTLDYPSVGATENLMLLAALTKGHTIIRNVAKEPEIVDLQNFLNAMGAKIYGAGNGAIIIEGKEKLRAIEYTPI